MAHKAHRTRKAHIAQKGHSTHMAQKAHRTIEVASVIELSEASGRVVAGLFMTEG